MRLRGTTSVVPFVVALAAMTPGLQAQAPDADERNRQAPGGRLQTQPRIAPQPPEVISPFTNPKPFGDVWFGRGPSAGPSLRRPNRVVCGTTIIQADPDTDRRMLKPAPDRPDSMQRVRPRICAD